MTRRQIMSTTTGTNQAQFAPYDWFLFVGVSLIWGASFVFIAIGLDSFEPGLVTWVRVASGAAVLAALPTSRRRIETEDWPRLVVVSFVWVAIPFTLFPIAQQWINSAVTGMLNGATPIITAVVASLMLRRLPVRVQLLGLAIGFAGVVAISLPSIGQGGSRTLGVALVLVATVGYGFAINVAAPLLERYGSVPVMAKILALAAIWTLPLGLLGVRGSAFSWPSLGAVLVLGVVGTGAAFAIMATLVGRVGSTRASFITYLIPVVALALGVIFRSDEVAPLALIGTVLVIAGAVMASRRDV